jgi:hypothetical protein
VPHSEPFVLREGAGRNHNDALCYSLTERSLNDDEGCFLEPIPEFADFNPISPTRWRSRINTLTLPSPTTSKPIQDASPQDPRDTDDGDADFDVSDGNDENPTLPRQQDLTSGHHRVLFDRINLAGLSDEALAFVSPGCQDGPDYHCQVRLVATKLRESTPPIPRARIRNILVWMAEPFSGM